MKLSWGNLRKIQIDQYYHYDSKMIIYTKMNSSTDLQLQQVKILMRDLFLIERYWAKTSEKLLCLVFGTQYTQNFSILDHDFAKQYLLCVIVTQIVSL